MSEQSARSLNAIHASAIARKRESYWIGFLEGVLASGKLEEMEVPALRAEAEQFLRLFRDEDAAEILRDLDTSFEDFHGAIFDAVQCIVDVRRRSLDPDDGKSAVNNFYGFCAGIACDNKIRISEVETLIEKAGQHPDIRDDFGVDLLVTNAMAAIEDGIVTSAESDDLASWICRIVGDSCADTGLSTFGNIPSLPGIPINTNEIKFDGRSFVLTGIFQFAPRKVITQRIVERQGQVYSKVNSRTDYLAVGSQASPFWKYSHAGTKILAAREMQGQKKKPRFVDEGELKRSLDA